MDIKIDFEFETVYGVFRDALYLPAGHALSDTDIDQMKQDRLTAWLYAVENPPAPEPETVVLDGVTYEKVEIDGQIVLKPVGV